MIHPLPLPPKEPNDAAEAGTGAARYRRMYSVRASHGPGLATRRKRRRRIEFSPMQLPQLRSFDGGSVGDVRTRSDTDGGGGIAGIANIRELAEVDRRGHLPTLGLNHAGFDSGYESVFDHRCAEPRPSLPAIVRGLFYTWGVGTCAAVALAVVWAWGRATGRGR